MTEHFIDIDETYRPDILSESVKVMIEVINTLDMILMYNNCILQNELDEHVNTWTAIVVDLVEKQRTLNSRMKILNMLCDIYA